MNTKNQSVSLFRETVGLVISLGVLMYLVPLLPVITSNYRQYLPIAVAATMVSSICDMLRRIYEKHADFFYALKLMPELFSTYMLFRIFPFDFSPFHLSWLSMVIQTILVISMLGIVIAMMFHFVRYVIKK